MHGDAPFLLEDGWKPLLNGKDLSGWHGQDPVKPNEWLTIRGVRWERLLGPTRLSGVKTPSGTMLNSLAGRTVNIVTDEKFGDVELYVEFLLPKGSNSGVYLQGLYEIQVFDSWGVRVCHPHRRIAAASIIAGSTTKASADRRRR